jgi:glycine/D-amino acid oxidase-like deaminating enzyme
MDRQVPESAQVVIVGGGVIGLNSALHLAERGITDVADAEGGDELAPYARLADARRFGQAPFTSELRQDGVDSYNRLFWWNLGSDLVADAV